jgi:hypothetical protein
MGSTSSPSFSPRTSLEKPAKGLPYPIPIYFSPMLRDDRREFQRLKLSKPILATMGTSNALILDIGIAGAFLEHFGTVEAGEQFPLTFRWQGQDVTFSCEVVRSTLVRPAGDGKSVASHTGVRFREGDGDGRARLQDLITTFVSNILAAQKANAAGENPGASAGATILARLGEARRMRSRGFISYHYDGRNWLRVPGSTSLQPPDGFTVGDFEEPDELEKLCRSYEQADAEGRNLIRLVAELSVIPDR